MFSYSGLKTSKGDTSSTKKKKGKFSMSAECTSLFIIMWQPFIFSYFVINKPTYC